MALIKCPECGKEISDKAQQCIHCGYPLKEQKNINTTSDSNNNTCIDQTEKSTIVTTSKTLDSNTEKEMDDSVKLQITAESVSSNNTANTTNKNTISPSDSVYKANKLEKRLKLIFAIFLIFSVIGMFGVILHACASTEQDKEDYADTLQRGREKYYSGETMTEEEYNAVKSFNKWKEKQGEHTYEEWDN